MHRELVKNESHFTREDQIYLRRHFEEREISLHLGKVTRKEREDRLVYPYLSIGEKTRTSFMGRLRRNCLEQKQIRSWRRGSGDRS